jgi:hypothetical protein
MKKIQIIFVILVAAIASLSLNQVIAQETKSVDINFKENYSDNQNGWQVGNYKYHTSEIANDSYIIKGMSKSKKTIVQRTMADGDYYYKDWEIIVKLKRTGGKSEKPYGFFWGKNYQQAYYFFINSINQIAIKSSYCDQKKYKYKDVNFESFTPSSDGSVLIKLVKKGN